MKDKTQLMLAAGFLTATTPFLPATTAHAESALNGSFNNVPVNTKSLTWYDNGADNTGTWINLSKCRASDGVNATVVALYRQYPGASATWLGDRIMNTCYTSQSTNYGPVGSKANFYFKVPKIGLSSATKLTTNYRVSY